MALARACETAFASTHKLSTTLSPGEEMVVVHPRRTLLSLGRPDGDHYTPVHQRQVRALGWIAVCAAMAS